MLSIHKVSIGPSNTTHFRSGVSAKANSLKVLATIPSVHCRGKKEEEETCFVKLHLAVKIQKHSEFLGLICTVKMELKDVCVLKYLMRHWVKLSKKLAHGNGFGVHSPINDLLFLSIAMFIHKSQGISQHMQNFGLCSKRLSYQHKTIKAKKQIYNEYKK